eukprot:3930336-Rhodomonas_salina.1
MREDETENNAEDAEEQDSQEDEEEEEEEQKEELEDEEEQENGCVRWRLPGASRTPIRRQWRPPTRRALCCTQCGACSVLSMAALHAQQTTNAT